MVCEWKSGTTEDACELRAAAVGTVHQLHLHTRGGCALTVCGTVFSMTDLGGGHNLVGLSAGVLCTVT